MLDTAPSATPPEEDDAALLRLGYRPSLGRSLGISAILTYGLLFFVPMAPVAVFGYVTTMSHGAPVLVYLVAALVMALSAISFREMARRFPVAGSVYGYTRLSAGRHLGFVAGWLVLLDYLLMPATLVVLAAVALDKLLPGVPVWAIVVVFVLVSMGLNLAGLTITTRVGVVLLAVQLLVLLVFGAYVVRALVAGHTEPALAAVRHPGVDVGAVLGAVSMAALSYLGFDAVNTLNEEARGGGRTVGRATVILLVSITVLFCAEVWAAALIMPVDTLSETDVARAFYLAVESVAPGWFSTVFTLTSAVLAIFSCLVVAHASTARLLFAMARDGVLPSVLARTDRRGGPYVAVLVVSTVALVLGVALAGRSALATSLVTFGALGSYVLLHVSVIVRCWHRERSGRWFTHLAVPLLGAASLLAVLSQTAPSTRTVGLLWLGVGGIGYALSLLLRSRAARG